MPPLQAIRLPITGSQVFGEITDMDTAGEKWSKGIFFIQNTASISPVLSGGEVRLLHLMRYFWNRHQCELFGFFSSNLVNREFNVRGGLVSRYSFYDLFSIYIAYVIKTIDLMMRLMFRAPTCQVIYASSDFFPDVLPSFFYKVLHPRVVWTQCVFHVYTNWKIRPGNFVVNWVAQHLQKVSFFLVRWKADKVIVINEKTQQQLIEFGIQEEKINLSPCGVDLRIIDRVPPSPTAYDGLFLGRLHPTKGVFDLLEIWKRVVLEIPGARLAIVGSGPASVVHSMNHRLSVYKLTHQVDLLGYLNAEQTVGLMKSAKVFLFPSHEEGWGMAIAEAMACRVPPVAWDLPVYKKVFGGLIHSLPENDFQRFSEVVVGLLTDQVRARQEGERGGDFIKRYDWENVCRHEEKIVLGGCYGLVV